MPARDSRTDTSGWAIGGGFMLGLGAGFLVLKVSVLAFVGCVVAGIGLGLVLAAVLSVAARH